MWIRETNLPYKFNVFYDFTVSSTLCKAGKKIISPISKCIVGENLSQPEISADMGSVGSHTN